MEKKSGLHAPLSSAAVYDLFLRLIGGDAVRRQVVARFIRPRPGDRVLDIGCGTGEWYPLLGRVDYAGFDACEEYIEAARRKFPSGRFSCARVETRPTDPNAAADIAIAIGVLHHLSNEDSAHLIRVAAAALKAGGRLITLDPCFDESQSARARFVIRRDRGKNVRTLAGYSALANRAFSSVEATLWLDPLRIPYTYGILECTK
jgi:SAM-dependent methyltransferase